MYMNYESIDSTEREGLYFHFFPFFARKSFDNLGILY